VGSHRHQVAADNHMEDIQEILDSLADNPSLDSLEEGTQTVADILDILGSVVACHWEQDPLLL